MAKTPRDFASLFAPQPAQLFRDHIGEKARFLFKARDEGRFQALFPWRTINRLIESDTLPHDRLRLARASNTIVHAMYRQPEPRDTLRLGKVQDLLRQGASVILNGIDDFVPPIGSLTSALEREFGCRVWCNAYLSFGAGSAFDAHYDRHDVLILQIHGRKRWRSYGVPFPHPVQEHSRRTRHERVEWEGVLDPGDVLYLPRGEVHAAVLEGTRAAHLTIGMCPSRGMDFAEALIQTAAEDVIFRQDIPRSSGEAALLQREALLKEALHALIERADLKSYLDGDDRARALRPFINLGVAPPFPGDTVVEPAVRRRVTLDTENVNEIAVAIGGEQFHLSQSARQILSHLITRGACRIDELHAVLAPPLTASRLHEALSELANQALVGIRV